MALWSRLSKKEETGVAPHFTQPLKSQVIRLNHPVTLQCAVVGSPVPTVKWFANTKEVKPVRGKQISYNPETGVATLKILKPREEDQCVFSVQAVNTLGRAECRANLVIGEAVQVQKPEVLHAPKITRPLKAQKVQIGTPVTLEAEFEGVPKPEVKWYRNGKEVILRPEMELVTEEHKTTLHIPEVQKPDSGQYEVRAVNPAGEARCSGSVSATAPEPEMAEVVPPRFIEPLKPQIVAEGEVVILETFVESHPTCSFQWFQRAVPIKSSPVLRIVSSANHSVLIIDEAVAQHGGTYTCRAENVAGSVTSTATLNVLPEVPWEETVEFESPHFVQELAPMRVMDGEEVQLICKVTGKPTPRVTWFHKNQPIKEAKDVVMYQDSEGVCKLAIQEVFPEDAGDYTCVAVNKMGEAVCSTSLVVEAYEYVPDSEIASVAVGTSLVTGQSGSEEDLLAEKETLLEVLEETQEVGSAPHFITCLPRTVPVQSGELTRLEVKVRGVPKPKVRWHKQGAEVIPSKDFQLEDLEDGTSVLTITEVFPDDTGEIICEAHNELGIDTTTTELVVEDILGTKEYRKPEWVTHMEELKEALKENSGNTRPTDDTESKITRMYLETDRNCAKLLQGNAKRPTLHLHELKEKSEEVLEIVYISDQKNSDISDYYVLSPIQESSEPSTAESSSGSSSKTTSKKIQKKEESTLKLLSASCEDLHVIDESMATGQPIKYQTFPRSKIPVLSPLRNNACYSVPEDPTMYPLEPRELDPASFNQLHMADSQEELQEFLLLESQCMTTEGRGLAAAFVTSDDEQNSSGEERGQGSASGKTSI